MKLLVESSDVEYLIENTESGPKNYFIEGIFMQPDVVNRNGRIYPRLVLENEVSKYQKMIIGNRSTGELGHPSNPSINLDRISHIITELKMDGDCVYGKAKIIDTPMGKIAKSLMDENIRLGVSSRGLGTLKETSKGKLVETFLLTTVDIVQDPSGPDCFPENLIENIEWVFDGAEWQKIEQKVSMIEEYKKQNREKREAEFLKFLNTLVS